MKSLCGLALFVLVCGCSGGGGGGGGSASPTPTPTGTATPTPTVTPSGVASGTVEVTANVQILMAPAPYSISYTAYVYSPDAGDEVSDATVEMGPLGAPYSLAYVAPMYAFAVNTSGLPVEYQLDVTRGGDFLTDVRFSPPQTHAVALSPEPPQGATDLTLTWTPSGDPYVGTRLVLQRNGGTVIDEAVSQPDSGSRVIDAATLTSGTYSIGFHRVRTTPLAGSNSEATVDLLFLRDFTIP